MSKLTLTEDVITVLYRQCGCVCKAMVVTPITNDKKPNNIMKPGRKKRDNTRILVNQIDHVAVMVVVVMVVVGEL